MEYRDPPERSYSREHFKRFRYDPRVREWAKQIRADPTATPADLNEDELRYLIAHGLNGGWDPYTRELFDRAMRDTTPVLSFPKLHGFVDSLTHITMQPEFRAFWRDWTVPRTQDGAQRSLEGSKALMTTMATPGATLHAHSAHDFMDPRDEYGMHLPRLRGLFDNLNNGYFAVPAYSSLMRHLKEPIAELLPQTRRAGDDRDPQVHAQRARHGARSASAG